MLKLLTGGERVTVRFVVDRDPAVPAIREAERQGISTLDNIIEALRKHVTDFVLEATGSDKVLRIIQENRQVGVEVVSSRSALMFYNVLEENRRKENRDLVAGMRTIGEGIGASTASVRKTLSALFRVSASLEMLSLNAATEATRAVEYGKSFAVVAEEDKKTAAESKKLLTAVEAVNQKNGKLTAELESLLQ